MKKEYTSVNMDKLHDELIENGIIPILVERIGDKVVITFKNDTNMELVQQIIDLHDSTPLPQESTAEELQIEYNIDLDYRISLIEMGLI